MKKFYFILTTLFLMGLLASCSKEDDKLPIITPPEKPEKPVDPTPPKRATTDEQYYANMFAAGVLDRYYLWNKEIAKDLNRLDPDTCINPIAVVDSIRYKDDKWTMLIDDYNTTTSDISGVKTTFGYDITVYKFYGSNSCYAIVNFVYADTPAEKAGIKRGDIFLRMNDGNITINNYTDLFYSANIKLGFGELLEGNKIGYNGKDVDLTAINTYENPIIIDKIFEFNGKKVGYLAYSNFDMLSIPNLILVSKKFKEAGVKELILDLRYNGGGYVETEEALASMYAPESAVSSKSIFHTNIYNPNWITDLNLAKDQNSYFRTSFEVSDENGNIVAEPSTADANIGLEKIYAIVTGQSASASEGLLIGLMPYFNNNIETIGETTGGKYCTGVVLAPKHVYQTPPTAINNWGIYVMIATFADCNGNNPSRPDGLKPTVPISDDPFDGFQLGDENETMLKVALQRAGKSYPAGTRSLPTRIQPPYEKKFIHRKAIDGMRIDTRASELIKETWKK